VRTSAVAGRPEAGAAAEPSAAAELAQGAGQTRAADLDAPGEPAAARPAPGEPAAERGADARAGAADSSGAARHEAARPAAAGAGAGPGSGAAAGPSGRHFTKWWADGDEPLYYVVSPKARSMRRPPRRLAPGPLPAALCGAARAPGARWPTGCPKLAAAELSHMWNVDTCK